MSVISYNENQMSRLQKKIIENRKEFIVIIGAGLSKAAGLPLWKDLANELIDKLEMKYQEDQNTGDGSIRITNLRNNSNYWDVFEILKKELGEHEYETLIKDRLNTTSLDIPPNYDLLWSLGISGVITFNLDRLLIDSYSKNNRSAPIYATGQEPHKYKNFFSASRPFILHAHGIIDDCNSWVMTNSERKKLYHNPEFINFMTSILNNRNLIILGFNPNENSFINLLEEIRIDKTIAGVDNYCIVPNADMLLDHKFQQYGFNIIGYQPKDEDKHLEVTEILKQLYDSVPIYDHMSTIYTGKIFTEQDIPDRTKIGLYTNDELRKILNGVVAGIIPNNQVPTEDEIQNLQLFYKKYKLQIHVAWLIDQELMGYKINSEIGKGSFGQVYEAYDADNNKFAIKVLLSEVKEKSSYLNCFRRGTRAMRILKDNNIEGMVGIHGAYEIPACIVMDYVEGSTLREAIDRHIITDVHRKFEVIYKIANIIHSAHQLKEIILHRDLKPENIILENYYLNDPNDSIFVKILDFDLAWHRDATEHTVFLGGLSQGFMAPEQNDADHHELTRNTAVDVYSIGMLLYYILCEKNPLPNQHEFKGFYNDIVEQIQNKYRFSWKILPEYIADTIMLATYHDQNTRLPLSTFIERLKIIQEMILNHNLPNMHPLILSELARNIDPTGAIEYKDNKYHITIKSPRVYMETYIQYRTKNYKTFLQIELRKMRGEADQKNITKFLSNAKDKALSRTNNSIFYYKRGDIQMSAISITLRATLPENVSLAYIREIIENIRDIRAHMDFS